MSKGEGSPSTPSRIPSTAQDKSNAFEWLRSIAVGDLEQITDEKDWFFAAVALQEWADLKASKSEMKEPIGLFWQGADGKWYFCQGSTKRGDIHDNGRPIRVAYLGEEAK